MVARKSGQTGKQRVGRLLVAAGLVELDGHDAAGLVDEVERLAAVDDAGRRHGQGARVLDERGEVVEDLLEVGAGAAPTGGGGHEAAAGEVPRRSVREACTSGGTRPETSPP